MKGETNSYLNIEIPRLQNMPSLYYIVNNA